MKTTALALALSTLASGALAEGAGLKIAQIHMPHHDAETRVAIWYPRGMSGTQTVYAENPVFRGVAAFTDTEPEAGLHPVVLFSHGMGGTDRAQAWLASALAERGAIVVMVNHPGSTWGDHDMARGVRHWTRAADLSRALDVLTDDPDLGPHLDLTRVMAAGFSFGGWTALSLGGATGNLDGIVAACTEQIATMVACDMLLSDRVGMQRQDPGLWNASYADPRVTSVVAIDPGFIWGLEAANVAGLVPDTVLIGLGDSETQMSATNFTESGLAALIPDARVLQLAPAFHFTAMPLCQPDGVAILEAEQDDPVCTDPRGTDREAVHAAIADTIAEGLGL
jgi:predicted dienelactone hydrolase